MTGDAPVRSRPPGVVFVAGLGHSGSTLLELLLCGSDRVVGLGEVHNHLRRSPAERARRTAEPCTCALALGSCPMWGPIAEVCEDPTLAVEEKYRAVLDHARSLLGEDVTLVDSSKNLASLRVLRSVAEDVAAVHLVRDVRSWSEATREKSRRWGQMAWRDLVRDHGTRAVSRRAKLTTWYRFRTWDRENRAFVDALGSLADPVVRVGYEPLATATGPVLEQLCSALGLAFDARMLVPSPTGGHLVGGNRMRSTPSKTSAVMYSTRWLTRREWLLPATVLRATMARNAEWVYDSAGTLPVDRYGLAAVAPRPPTAP